METVHKTLQQKIEDSSRLLLKYPDRIPLIIEKEMSDSFLNLKNCKYLIPKDMTVGDFLCIIRTKINKTFNEKKAIFTFVKSVDKFNNSSYILIPMNNIMGDIYRTYKLNDGYLYIKFGIENTFG
jgi:GABA(A) receptor-associated protein